MKLALLLVLCLLAGAFNAARAQGPPPPPSGPYGGEEGGDGELAEGGPFEGEDGEGEGPFEGEELEGPEGPEGPGGPEDEEGDPELGNDDDEFGGGDEEDEQGDEKPPEDPNNPNLKPKPEGAAGHHGYHRRRHYRRRYHPRFGGYWGGFGYGRGYRFGHHHRNRDIDRSTCSVQASYFLSFNGQRRYCRYATDDHDDCQACCEAATRRETRGADKDDIIGFITLNVRGRHGGHRDKREAGLAYGGGDKGRDDNKWECVCCIPKHGRH